MIDIIAFDADDTLWHNETLFHLTHQRFEDLLSEYHSKEWIEEKLFETEMRNLDYFGYGIKGFTLSMIETAVQLTEGRIKGEQIQTILGYAREMIKAPVELLDHVHETILRLGKNFPLMLVTKGDLFDQESKIARSGLSDHFSIIEILSKKNKKEYDRIFKKHKINPKRLLMVGNSLKSDILPALESGAQGVFVPYPLCWQHEKVEESDLIRKNFHQLEHIGQLPDLIKKLSKK